MILNIINMPGTNYHLTKLLVHLRNHFWEVNMPFSVSSSELYFNEGVDGRKHLLKLKTWFIG